MFRNQFTELITKDMYKVFFDKYDSLTPVYSSLFDTGTMDGAYEKETTLVGAGKLSRRKEGDPIASTNAYEGDPVHGKAVTFSDGIWFTNEQVQDAKKGEIANILKDYAKTWAEGFFQTKEDESAKLFRYGGYTAGHDVFDNSVPGTPDPSGKFIYDGKPFFNLSGNLRSNKAGGTFYNGHALNLTADNFKTVYTRMTSQNNRDERGNIVNIKPDVIVVPPALYFTAMEIVKNANTANIRSVLENIVQVQEWQFIDDSDAWFIGKKGMGIKFRMRQEPIIDFFQNPLDKKWYATVDARFSVYVNNWRYWSGSNFSTS